MTLSLQSADAIESTIAKLRELARSYEAQIGNLKADNAYLKRENASLWNSLREAEEAVKELRSMIERAHTEPTR